MKILSETVVLRQTQNYECAPNTCICWFEDAGCDDCTDCGYVGGCINKDD